MDSYLEQNRTLAALCEMTFAENRLTLLFAENFCFVFFQIFQLYFCLHAAQQYEVESVLNLIMSECPGVYTLSPNYELYEYPNMIVSSAFSLVNLIFAWRLFLLFEKQMYEKVDVEINHQGQATTQTYTSPSRSGCLSTNKAGDKQKTLLLPIENTKFAVTPLDPYLQQIGSYNAKEGTGLPIVE
ncbi:12960_t:CDS:2 [Cetraspora pellucida]|uniref:12960_t:CDS:1 n=1 Tax=Cetraspora pellucida TaxID=1433469 RepID=A0ACA9K9T2_9GLOM|nr:12960_t:CDS:2 [Cetraspora pellucida]